MSAKGAAKHRAATYADIEALPAHKLGEIVGDELVVSPRPAPLHALATTALAGALNDPSKGLVDGPKGWWILFEPELHFEQQVLVPDIAGWRRDRMPALPRDAFFDVSPDWLCETLSPSTAVLDRTRKLEIYRQQRVGYVWLVDPIARTLEALGLEGEGWRVLANHGGDETIRVAPFEGVELDLSRLWPGVA
jgi:Uma2 family endonuclease